MNNKSRKMANDKQMESDSEEARAFEEALIKLVDLAKGRVKYEEFNP
jgi:hypothetical protein